MSEPPRDAGAFRFPARLRIRRRRDFEQGLSRGARSSDERLKIWVSHNGLDVSRLGLIVGRRFGNAVHRNRAKRIVREAFRLSRADLPVGLDILCSPRAGVELELQECMRSLEKLTRRLTRRLASSSPVAETPGNTSV